MMREKKSGKRGEGAGYSDKVYVNGIGDTKLGCDENFDLHHIVDVASGECRLERSRAKLAWHLVGLLPRRHR